jgi:hypothetical protein
LSRAPLCEEESSPKGLGTIQSERLRHSARRQRSKFGIARPRGALGSENELRIDQSKSARPKEFPTIETYERHLIKRIIPRWGNLAPLAVKSTEVEKWLLELRRGNPQKEVKPFADPTVARFAHHAPGLQARAAARISAAATGGQSHGLGEPANDQRLHGGPDDAEAGVRVSGAKAHAHPERRGHGAASVGVAGPDVDGLDFADLVMYVRRAYVWARFKVPKSKVSKAPVPMHPLLAGFLLAWRDKTPFGEDTDFVFPSVRLRGKRPLSASTRGCRVTRTSGRLCSSTHGQVPGAAIG